METSPWHWPYLDIRTWFSNVEQHASEGVHKILIGNKCDWEEKRAVSTEQGQRLADELGIPFLEVSAKNNINIENAFFNLASDIKKGMDTSKSEQAGSQSVNIDQQGSGLNGSAGGKCCWAYDLHHTSSVCLLFVATSRCHCLLW